MVGLFSDKSALLEPNLLLPFKASINHIRLNPYWKYYNDLFYVYCPAVSDTMDLVSKIQGTRVGTFNLVGSKYGINIKPTATSSYLSTGVTSVPSGEPYNTILYVGVNASEVTSGSIFATRRNSSNPTWYCGVWWVAGSAAVGMYYGDNTGPASSDYKGLWTNYSIINFPVHSICGRFKTSTTGSLYINGKLMSLTSSGTGGSVAGTGNLTLYDSFNFSATNFSSIYLLAIFNTQLPDPVMQSLSADPYQIFTAL